MAPDRSPKTNEAILTILDSYLALGDKYQTRPYVRLQLSTNPVDPLKKSDPNDTATTTAIQCYSPGRAIIKERGSDSDEDIRSRTLEAGHHTTRMHTYFTFHLGDVTRSAIHNVFHAYPYYNSEQQSQRYVEVRGDNYQVPRSQFSERFKDIASQCNRLYFELLDLLYPSVKARVEAMYPNGWNNPKRAVALESKVKKLCQEVARYVLPIGQFTELKHSLSHLQLLRLFHVINHPLFSDEERLIIALMVKAVCEKYPSFIKELELPMHFATVENFDQAESITNNLADSSLPRHSHSRMLNDPREGFNSALIALRLIDKFKRVERDELFYNVLNARDNPFIADVYDSGIHDPITSSLNMVHLTFETQLSHTADSQRQRHRTTPGASPMPWQTFTGDADFILPKVIAEEPELMALVIEALSEVYDGINKLIRLGMSPKDACLLLPNAHTVKVVETGNLLGWIHRFKQRLCYLAQEEFFYISVEQAQQAIDAIPALSYALQAPCGLRKQAGVAPYCPEKAGYCGVPVFNFEGLEQYAKHRVI